MLVTVGRETLSNNSSLVAQSAEAITPKHCPFYSPLNSGDSGHTGTGNDFILTRPAWKSNTKSSFILNHCCPDNVLLPEAFDRSNSVNSQLSHYKKGLTSFLWIYNQQIQTELRPRQGDTRQGYKVVV